MIDFTVTDATNLGYDLINLCEALQKYDSVQKYSSMAIVGEHRYKITVKKVE